MTATIIDGKAVAAEIREGLKLEVDEFKKEFGREPGLAVVIVGEDPASRTYVNSKKKGCAELGMYSEEHALPEQTTQAELESLVKRLNLDPKIDGILVQLPLPKHMDADAVISTIDPMKDVDGFHPVNIGNLLIGRPCLKSCTPAGIMELIKRSGVDLTGKHAVVVGRSNIVGKPVAVLLLEKHATVTICHSRTKDLAEMCKMADVLVAAVGKAKMIKGEWIKPGAVVIDVGTNKVEGSKKLVGDVDFDAAKEIAGWITPVPGGVGPMTITMLMHNTIKAARAIMTGK
ncbi:MAG TPA: bifunctional methylenetetrahydrofolate dehydrogenase/methenyltetrahydrofolate cyclohydrolase FolD [Bacillota bacterium]|nr:bifunctional methylenetetrahydrofolate dehydrogenase/methenyltetrahydrofolate cyclohydrolase FolD [Bacillota bacterium]HOH09473.1 bifunctional methylenetetrahydrofolate dehydrogenase/methenyltetrahydrofolate cyclohydrolase FolD [Bacillota bacterium]HOS50361.1 bifunctional methylenetetrahydrofolate dehydrogenase/methenyltetrahydrofolate cyclohydrolase FolD [Bacillota bacterium]HOY88168.1 bifunctional methylenetetrahydrofolate dehydrogenase/methenyltetrahydrofolate cyclohydrolase FolD [Bacillot